jgi:hypothetical protein
VAETEWKSSLEAKLGGYTVYLTSSEGEFSVVYVPKNAVAGDRFIPVEVVRPSREESVRARAIMWVLEQQVGEYMHPMQDGTRYVEPAKCEAMVLQLRNSKTGEKTDPYFRAECFSDRLWAGDKGLQRIGVFDSVDDLLVFVERFSSEHFKRRRESILRRTDDPGLRT